VAKINSCLNYAKAILNLKLSQKLSPQNSADEVNSIATQAFEQRLLEEMNENPFRSREEEDEYEKMSLKAKIMTTMTILNLIELRQKISISMNI
jgi:hypothetical protein